MENPTADQLNVLAQAWRNNVPPKYPTQYEAYLSLFDTHGRPLTATAKISWNVFDGCYEMEPMVEAYKGVYSLTELVLSAENFAGLSTLLAKLGVHQMIRVRIIDQPVVEKKSSLPASCFPTVVGREPTT